MPSAGKDGACRGGRPGCISVPKLKSMLPLRVRYQTSQAQDRSQAILLGKRRGKKECCGRVNERGWRGWLGEKVAAGYEGIPPFLSVSDPSGCDMGASAVIGHAQNLTAHAQEPQLAAWRWEVLMIRRVHNPSGSPAWAVIHGTMGTSGAKLDAWRWEPLMIRRDHNPSGLPRCRQTHRTCCSLR